MRHLLFLLPLALSLAACGPQHEGTVTYRVGLGPGDVTGNTITEDVRVEPDDEQWSAFLSQARGALGEDPTRFEVTDVRIQLDVTRSRNVGTLQDVLVGDVAVFLRSGTGTQVDIAEVEDPKGSAQVSMDSTGQSLEPLSTNLRQGDFRLGLRGGTTRSPTGDFDATLLVTLDVTAR